MITSILKEPLLGWMEGIRWLKLKNPDFSQQCTKTMLQHPGEWSLNVFILRRTIDTVVIGYAKQNFTFFLVDLDLIMDVVSLFINWKLVFCNKTWSSYQEVTSYGVVLVGVVWTDSSGHGGECYDGFHGSTPRGAITYHLSCNIIGAKSSTLFRPRRVRPSVLLRQSAMYGKEWWACAAEQDAILQHSW
jgi:hypothetical protein